MSALSHQPPAGRRRRVGRGWLPLLGLALTACSGGADTTMNPALGWSEAQSPKRVEVELAEYRHAVHFATDSAWIDDAERARLLRFLAALEPTADDAIRIEGHADERAGDAYNLGLSARRAASVRDLLRREGLAQARFHPVAYGERAPAVVGSGPEVWEENRRVEVVVDRHVVVLPPCPDWSVESGTDFANLPHSNYGCATQTNFGLMLANPSDLARGQELGPADGVHAAEGVVRYRTGAVTELDTEGFE
jgi:pilus biogenesis lipoprotein CpaD